MAKTEASPSREQGARLLSAPTLWQLLEQRAALSPDDTLLIEAATDTRVSFGAFHRRVLDLAGWLHGQGVGAETVVAWQLPTAVQPVVVSFALARLGAIQAPVIHLYRERELSQILTQARADFIIVPDDEAHLSMARAVATEIPGGAPRVMCLPASVPRSLAPEYEAARDEAVRWYYFTSGTTSRPKGARHTDQTLMAGSHHMAVALDVSAADVGSIGYPIGHIGGTIYCATALMAGMAVVLIDRYIPYEVVAAFCRYGVTLGGGSTAHYQMLLAEQERTGETPLIPTMKVLAGGGAAKPAGLFEQVRTRVGATIVHAYGMTEAPISANNSRHGSDDQLTHSDGMPMPGLELRIVDSAGNRVPAGQSGEILLRGPNVCKGYLDPAQTAAAFDDEGFLHTGDLGMIRPDGSLCVTGRIKDVIIRKGENISAREIEELLLGHPKVADVAVIGLPDPIRGELVCAVVELSDPGDPLGFPEMVAHLADRKLMRQKIPERLEIVDCLPRNEGLQKVVKAELRARFTET
ncbi:MAG: cyclohexanecarboxylate-CoA ligase [Porticoccaceae bacterium]|nr:cyclohexanecarboxylate-CoA ligase [Porticoccaceae bacterium]